MERHYQCDFLESLKGLERIPVPFSATAASPWSRKTLSSFDKDNWEVFQPSSAKLGRRCCRCCCLLRHFWDVTAVRPTRPEGRGPIFAATPPSSPFLPAAVFLACCSSNHKWRCLILPRPSRDRGHMDPGRGFLILVLERIARTNAWDNTIRFPPRQVAFSVGPLASARRSQFRAVSPPSGPRFLGGEPW